MGCRKESQLSNSTSSKKVALKGSSSEKVPLQKEKLMQNIAFLKNKPFPKSGYSEKHEDIILN